MHLGNFRGGHYTAYRRNSDTTWSYFNDSTVTIVPQDDIKALAAERGSPHLPYEFTPTLFIYENRHYVPTHLSLFKPLHQLLLECFRSQPLLHLKLIIRCLTRLSTQGLIWL